MGVPNRHHFVAQAHFIPVVDGGVEVQKHPIRDELFAAHWRASVTSPVHQCMRCCGQYTNSEVTVDLDGSLDDPCYIANLPADQTPRNENVFPFTLYVTSMFVDMMLRFLLSRPSWPTVAHLHYVFVQAELNREFGECKDNCDFRARHGMGDRADPPYLAPAEEKAPHRVERKAEAGGPLTECVRSVRSVSVDIGRRLLGMLRGKQ